MKKRKLLLSALCLASVTALACGLTACGDTPEKEHSHNWGTWTVTESNKPTETEAGKATRTCSNEGCDGTAADKEYTLPALTSEDYSKSADTATCTAGGSVTYYYNKDGVTVSFEIATQANGAHPALTKMDEKPATCTTAGNVLYYHCDTCGNDYGDEAGTAKLESVTLAVDPAAHSATLTKVDEKSATCTTAGNVLHYHCDACDNNFSDEAGTTKLDSVVVESTPTSHPDALTKVDEKSATCTTAGNVLYYHCDACDNNFSDEAGTTKLDSVVVESTPTSHPQLTKVDEVPATCTTAGNVLYYHCDACDNNFSDEAGTTKLDSVVVESTPTSHPELKTVAAVPANCVSVGEIAHYHCDTCGNNYSDRAGTTKLESITGTALNPNVHPEKLTRVEEVEGTCISAGVAAHYECKSCNKLYRDSAGLTEQTLEELQTSQKINNHATELVHVDEVLSTCVEEGVYEHLHCESCGNDYDPTNTTQKMSLVVMPTDATNHPEELEEHEPTATCAQDGYNSYWYCKYCQKNCVLLSGKYSPTVNNIIPSLAASKVPHTYQKVDAVAWSCTQTGNVAHYTCSVCNKFFFTMGGTAYETDDAMSMGGHQVFETPTLSEDGTTVSGHCSVCGAEVENLPVNKIEITAATTSKPNAVNYYTYTHLLSNNKGNAVKVPFLGAGTYTFTAFGYVNSAQNNTKTNPCFYASHLVKAGLTSGQYTAGTAGNTKLIASKKIDSGVANKDGLICTLSQGADNNTNITVFTLQINELFGDFPAEIYINVQQGTSHGASDVLLYVTYTPETNDLSVENPLEKGKTNKIAIIEDGIVPEDSYNSGWTFTSAESGSHSLKVTDEGISAVYIKKNGKWTDLITESKRQANFDVVANEPVQFYFSGNSGLYETTVEDWFDDTPTITAEAPVNLLALPARTVSGSTITGGAIGVLRVTDITSGKYQLKFTLSNGLLRSPVYFGKNISENAADYIADSRGSLVSNNPAQVYMQMPTVSLLESETVDSATNDNGTITIVLDLQNDDRLVFVNCGMTAGSISSVTLTPVA